MHRHKTAPREKGDNLAVADNNLTFVHTPTYFVGNEKVKEDKKADSLRGMCIASSKSR